MFIDWFKKAGINIFICHFTAWAFCHEGCVFSLWLHGLIDDSTLALDAYVSMNCLSCCVSCCDGIGHLSAVYHTPHPMCPRIGSKWL